MKTIGDLKYSRRKGKRPKVDHLARLRKEAGRKLGTALEDKRERLVREESK